MHEQQRREQEHQVVQPEKHDAKIYVFHGLANKSAEKQQKILSSERIVVSLRSE
jgi:hypothetical protein